MDPNAHRSRGRNAGADAYWQRRFFTLVAGLGVVGLLAWACSGVASGGNSSHQAGPSRPSPADYGSTGSGTPSPSPTVTATTPASPSASPAASPSGSPSGTPSASGRAAQARPAQTPRAPSGPTACPASGLVLTLVTSKPSYGPADTPAFQVDIVSTGTATCLLDTGPAALRLLVLHGSQLAYNSAACLQGARRHVISLHRGVPVVTSMAWNKHLTVTGCRTTVMAATNRTYSAVVQAGGARSPRSSFRLTGAPATARTSARNQPTAKAR